MSDIWDNVRSGLVDMAGLAVTEFRESDYAAKCESEIERAFAGAYLLSRTFLGVGVSFSKEVGERDGVDQFLEPQYQIGDYRVDFLLGSKWSNGNLLKCIVIECDGHDYHDKTKEQAARDKARDRFLSANVGKVLRFTGSEIYRDPLKCAVEADKVLWITHLGFDPEKL